MESFIEFFSNKKSPKGKKESEEKVSSQEIIEEVKPIEEETPVIESAVIEDHKIDKEILENKSSIVESVIEESVIEEESYRIYRDKSETFLCDMEITGANPENSKARIIIESKDLTYMFEGTIDSKGQCKIPLKKMNFLQENETGTIKLEVIAEDMVFVPWIDKFTAISSRKVKVNNISESEDNSTKVGIRVTRIK